MTFDMMRHELDRLRGLRFVPADYRTHWEGLRDVPLSALSAAVGLAAKQCQDFPTPAELRTLVDAGGTSVVALEDRSAPLAAPVVIEAPFLSKPITVAREWKYYCETCSDTGWEGAWCGDTKRMKPWQSRWDCGRTHDHDPHEWVRKCLCFDTNAALVNKRASQAKYAAQRSDRRSA